jgi:hypothetical protein
VGLLGDSENRMGQWKCIGHSCHHGEEVPQMKKM